MDMESPLSDALKQQSLEKGENWLSILEEELNRVGMGDIWRRGGRGE
jgi:hypothetical protein